MATLPLPPVLLTTVTRTGTSFSRSNITVTARASTSLPLPGPVWTTSSTGRVGLYPWACAAPAAQTSAAATAQYDIFLGLMDFLLTLVPVLSPARARHSPCRRVE